MSASEAGWSSALPTKEGAYLFVGDIWYCGGKYEYASPKLFEVGDLGIKAVHARNFIVTKKSIYFHTIGPSLASELLEWEGFFFKLEFPCFNWTSEAPVKAGIYFFQGSVFDREFADRAVIELFDCNDRLEACIPLYSHRARLSDFDGLWCEVVVPPLPESKDVVDCDDNVPF